MELRVLRYFLTVAQEESITRAAAVLHLTQPTLSRQLTQLEQELGVRLFERGSRRISLTGAGMLLKRRAEELLSLAGRTERELSGGPGQLEGEISLGCGELESVRLLAGLMRGFSELHPGVRFELFSATADVIRLRMDRGLTDIGLLLEPVGMEKYDFIRLGVRERWVAVMRPDDPLASLESVAASDLVSRPLITAMREAVRSELASWFGDFFPRLDIRCTVNLSTNAAVLARQGYGVCLVVEGSLPYLDPRELVCRPLSPPLSSTSVLAWKRGAPQSPAVSRFIEHIKCSLSMGSHDKQALDMSSAPP